MPTQLVALLLVFVSAQGLPPPEPFPAGFAKGAYRAGPGVITPVPRVNPSPRYTDEARARKIVGEVEVLAVVLPDGKVGAVRLLTSIDPQFGLDEEALAVARRYVFDPGRKDGVAVPVVATIFVTFRLPGAPLPALRVVGGTADPPDVIDPMMAKGAVRPGQGVLRPLPSKKVYPVPPPGTTTTGRVTVVAVIRTDGTVGDVKLVETLDPMLDADAVAAVRQWTFEPAIKDGVPTPVVLSIFVDYTRAPGR